MSSITQSLVDKRIAEILYERENAKRLEEEKRIQAEIDAEARRRLVEAELAEKKKQEEERRIQFEIEAAARRAIIEAELAEKRRLEEERRIQAEIDRAAIATIVAVKRDDINKKQEEIEFYRKEIIRVQTDISKINNEIISFNHIPVSPKNITSIDAAISKRTWKKSNEYEVDNSDEGINKVSTLNEELTKLVTIIKNKGKITLYQLREIITNDTSIHHLFTSDGISIVKRVQDNMTTLIEMGVLKKHN